MPSLQEINKRNKSFKKREYRPWNPEGHNEYKNNGTVNDDNTNVESIILVEPELIVNWELHDRPDNELGDIEVLANELIETGQQQPCIVRLLKNPQNNNHKKYELIVGERRWRAAQIANIKLKVIVKDLTNNDAAIVQASENLNRKDLSDYARGMSYTNLLKNKVITHAELTTKLGMSKQKLSRLLSFDKIPDEIKRSIHDFSKVSARTAEQIKQLSDKGIEHVDAIIAISHKIREGKIRHEKIKKLVDGIVNTTLQKSEEIKTYANNGQHLFSIKTTGSGTRAIILSRYLNTILEAKSIPLAKINEAIKNLMEDIMKN